MCDMVTFANWLKSPVNYIFQDYLAKWLTTDGLQDYIYLALYLSLLQNSTCRLTQQPPEQV